MSVSNLNIEEIICELERVVVEINNRLENVIEQASRMEYICCSYSGKVDLHIALELEQIYVAYRELIERDKRDMEYTMAVANNMISRLNDLKIPIQLKGE